MKKLGIFEQVLVVFFATIVIMTLFNLNKLTTFKMFLEIFFLSISGSLILVGLFKKNIKLLIAALLSTQIMFLMDSIFKLLFVYNNSFVDNAIQLGLVLLFSCLSFIAYRLCKETKAFEEFKLTN